MTCPDGSRGTFSSRLAEVLGIHFDPEHGSPYWIEIARRLGFDPRTRVQTIEELDCFGFMDQHALRSRPLLDFVPRRVASRPEELMIVQTGGSLGDPIWTAYTREDYDAAFVRPFVDAATHVGFPTGGTWLYVGPSGPHVMGRAARSIARANGAIEPFTVDFDSRWAKKLPPESFAAQRYLRHVLDQTLGVIRVQSITHLFSTPPVLAAIGAEMTADERSKIRGVHYGGLALTPEELRRFQQEVFPNAVHLSGYGNTLFGCCLELDASPNRTLRYYPWGSRIHFGVLPNGETKCTDICHRPGARGRCIFTRLDSAMLLINFLERDEIALANPPSDAPAQFKSSGVIEPTPIRNETRMPNLGLY